MIKKILVLIFIIASVKSVYAYDFEAGGLYYTIISTTDLTCKVVSGDEKYTGDVIIPETVTYKNRDLTVTSIEGYAFYNCSSLTTVDIPNSVTSIGNGAFRGCSSLTSIDIPNSVTSIGGYAFSGSGLTSIDIPNSVTSIVRYAFSSCSSLTTVDIPNSVTSIGKSAFENCSSLTTVEIPNSVTSIGTNAFNELRELIIDESEQTLNYDYSNYGAYPLDSLVKLKAARYMNCDEKEYNSVFPNVTDLYIDNFELNSKTICYKVQKLTLGKNATIDKYLRFSNCNDLECITLGDPTATITCPNSFTTKQYTDLIIYVPKGSLATYQNAEGWKKFWDIREIQMSGISEVNTNGETHEVERYNIKGQPVTDDYRGFVIIKYSDGTTRKIINK